MSCVKLPIPPPIPILSGGLTIPPFTIGGAVGINYCCQFNLAAFITTPNVAVVLPAAILAPLNLLIITYDQVLAWLDLIGLSCPLE